MKWPGSQLSQVTAGRACGGEILSNSDCHPAQPTSSSHISPLIRSVGKTLKSGPHQVIVHPIHYSLRAFFGKQKGILSRKIHFSHLPLWSVATVMLLTWKISLTIIYRKIHSKESETRIVSKGNFTWVASRQERRLTFEGCLSCSAI